MRVILKKNMFQYIPLYFHIDMHIPNAHYFSENAYSFHYEHILTNLNIMLTNYKKVLHPEWIL